MSTDALPQYPDGQSGSAYGYWPPRGGSSPAPAGHALAYVAAALILGALSGTVMAAVMGPQSTPGEFQVAVVAKAPSHPVPAAAVSVPAQPALAAASAPTASPLPAANTIAPTPAVHIVLASYKTPGHHRRHRRRAHSLRSAHPAARVLDISVVAPTPVVAPLPRVLMIEGDVTVAGYDAAAGMIETREGMNFVIDRAVGDRNASLLEDSSGSFHYRCDQQGSCTLAHAGLAFSAARMTT